MHDDSFASPVARLYANHHGWLRGWLHRRLGHSADAEDLAHDTFVRVMRSQEDVRELRQPMAFLATIANGLLINRWRRQAIEQAYLEALAARPVAEEPSPEERHLMIETLLQLDSLLVGLSSRVRQIFFVPARRLDLPADRRAVEPERGPGAAGHGQGVQCLLREPF